MAQHDLADEMDEREEELEAATRNRAALQAELHDVIRHITQETSDVSKLEAELGDGTQQFASLQVL